jgi:hypothetical protein
LYECSNFLKRVLFWDREALNMIECGCNVWVLCLLYISPSERASDHNLSCITKLVASGHNSLATRKQQAEKLRRRHIWHRLPAPPMPLMRLHCCWPRRRRRDRRRRRQLQHRAGTGSPSSAPRSPPSPPCYMATVRVYIYTSLHCKLPYHHASN